MKAEITNNVSGTGDEILDYSIGRLMKAVYWSLSFQAVIHCHAVGEFGGTPRGPRCQFRLGNDNVTLPMSFILLAR